MRDIDDEPERPDWYAGPPPRTRGPVIEAYVDTDALDYECPNCEAPEGEFCRHPAENGGQQRSTQKP